MKKLLFALLIALVVSTVVQTEEKELEGIAEFIKSLVGKVKKVYNFLKSKGYWNSIVSHVKNGDKLIAYNVCTGYTGENSACSQLVDGLAQA